MATQQVVPPASGSAQNIINGQDPAQKSAFLHGQIDPAQPLLYYDLEKEIAFVFLPNGLQLTNADQEKIIGRLTNKLVNTLPAEERKFFLLNPKPFLSLDSLVKAVFEADGITEADLKAQQERVQLLEEIFQMQDEAALKAKIKENDDKLDRQFFEILTTSIQAAQMEGGQAAAQALLGLRAFIGKHSSQGRQAIKEIDEEMGVIYVQTQEELLEKLKNAQNDEEFTSLVAAGHAFMDYGFFQTLTGQIDAAAKAGDQQTETRLKTLRAKILETKGHLEEQSRASMEKAVEFLKKVLQSDDPVSLLVKNADQVNDAFFAVLSANIQEARRQKREDVARGMEMIGNMALSMIQEAQGGGQTAPTPTGQPQPESDIEIAK